MSHLVDVSNPSPPAHFSASAGAHRNTNPDKSADVTHADESVFEDIHEAEGSYVDEYYMAKLLG